MNPCIRGVFDALIVLSLLATQPPTPAPPIRLPDLFRPADPTPAPSPMPGPAPAVVVKLTTDRLCIMDWDVPVIVIASPPGLVVISQDSGPMRVRGVFAGGKGKPETKNFAGKYLFTIEGTHAGRVEILVFPVGAKSDAEVYRQTLDIDMGEPTPPPTPTPAPKPKPATPVKIKAVTVYESGVADLGADSFFGSKELAARWLAKGHLPPIEVDQDVKDPDTKLPPAKLKPYLDRAKGKSLPQMYLIDAATGVVLYEGPRPETPAALMTILDSIGA
jgi:hypothetical protein